MCCWIKSYIEVLINKRVKIFCVTETSWRRTNLREYEKSIDGAPGGSKGSGSREEEATKSHLQDRNFLRVGSEDPTQGEPLDETPFNANISIWLYFQHDVLQNKLNEIFKSLTVNENRSPSEEDTKKSNIPTYEQNFPELFYYWVSLYAALRLSWLSCEKCTISIRYLSGLKICKCEKYM